jgi:monoterpene epsilon-lactone hydrolase
MHIPTSVSRVNMSANTPLTDEQRNAVAEMRAAFSKVPLPLGTAESVDERARRPDPESVPADVTVRVEIAPPSPQPHPLLDSAALKMPERVPVYFFALHSDCNAQPVDTRVIFFIHGGGDVVGHPTHVPFVQFYIQLLRVVASLSGDTAAAKCVLIAPSYRLSTIPENTFPAAPQDLVAAYDYVLGKGYDASNIIIAGDSAGGNHGQCARALADTTRGTDSALLQRSC